MLPHSHIEIQGETVGSKVSTEVVGGSPGTCPPRPLTLQHCFCF